MRGIDRSTVTAALGALVAAFVVVVASPGPASALPAVCSSGASNVATWTHNAGTTQNWDTPGNWNPVGLPSTNSIACISTTDTIVVGEASIPVIQADQVFLEGSTKLVIPQGMGLLVNGAAESVWGPGTTVTASGSRLGGAGTIRAQGNVNFTSGPGASAMVLTSSTTAGGGQQPPADRGDLVVEGHATVNNFGLAMYSGYRLSIAAGGSVAVTPNAWFAGDAGTSLTVNPGGTLNLTGDGGYYQGAPVAGQPQNELTNNGTLVKSGGSAFSVVDATYQGTGQIVVQQGALALPDNQAVSAIVAPGSGLATARCDGTSPTTTCQPTVDPAKDAMNLLLTVPSTNGVNATVQIQELPPVGAAVDPQQIGNEVLAHADNLVPDGAHPAKLNVRYTQADVMSTPLGEVQVVHTTDAGAQVLLPDCVGEALPAGISTCVERPVVRTSQYTLVTVLTTVTSRWHLRRNLPVPNQGAPGVPLAVTVAKASGGAALDVAWTAPLSSGAGPLSSYAVYLDGTRKASPTGTSVVLHNPGPGKHLIAVSALNAAGEGARSSVSTVKLADLSKPRKVKSAVGAAGGKLTAGAAWKPPADPGGLKLKGYQVAVFRNGKRIDTQKVGAAARKYLFTLSRGEYEFRVRARNGDGFGPWSKPTDAVRPR